MALGIGNSSKKKNEWDKTTIPGPGATKQAAKHDVASQVLQTFYSNVRAPEDSSPSKREPGNNQAFADRISRFGPVVPEPPRDSAAPANRLYGLDPKLVFKEDTSDTLDGFNFICSVTKDGKTFTGRGGTKKAAKHDVASQVLQAFYSNVRAPEDSSPSKREPGINQACADRISRFDPVVPEPPRDSANPANRLYGLDPKLVFKEDTIDTLDGFNFICSVTKDGKTFTGRGDKAEDFKTKDVMKVEQLGPQEVAFRRLMAERARNRALKVVTSCTVAAPPVARMTTHWDQISQRFGDVTQLSNGDKPSKPVLDTLGFWKPTLGDETRMAQPQETPTADPSLAPMIDVNPGDVPSSSEDIQRKKNKGDGDYKRGKTKDDYGRPCATTTKDQSVQDYKMIVHREVAKWAKNGTPKEVATKNEVAAVPGPRKRRWNQDAAGFIKASSTLDLAKSAKNQEACNTKASVVRGQNRMNNAKQSKAAEAGSSQIRVWDVISRYLSPAPGEDTDHGAIQDHPGLRLISENYSGVESQPREEGSKNKRLRESEITSEVRNPVIKMTSKGFDRLSQPRSGQELSLTRSSNDESHQSRYTGTKNPKEERYYDKQSINKRLSESEIPLKEHPTIPSTSKSSDQVSQPLSGQGVSLTSSDDESDQIRYSSKKYHKRKRYYAEQSKNKRSRVSEIPSKVRNPMISLNSKSLNQVYRHYSCEEVFSTSSAYDESLRSRYTSKKDHKGKRYYDEQSKVRELMTVMTSEDLRKKGKKLRKKEKRRQEKEQSKRRARHDEDELPRNHKKHSEPLTTTSSSSYISSELSQIFDNLVKARSVKKPENKEKTVPLLPKGSNCNDTSFKCRPATFAPSFNRRALVEEEGKEIENCSDQAKPEQTKIPNSSQDKLQRINAKHGEPSATKTSFSYDTSALSTLFDNFVKNQLSRKTEDKEKTQSPHSKTPSSMSLGPDPDVTLFDSRSMKNLKASGVLEEKKGKRSLEAMPKHSSSQDTRGDLESTQNQSRPLSVKSYCSYDSSELSHIFDGFLKNRSYKNLENKRKTAPSNKGSNYDVTGSNSRPADIATNINLQASLEEVFEVVESRGFQTRLELSTLCHISQDGDASLHAKIGEPSSAPSSSSYDAPVSSQLFDSRLMDKSVKKSADKSKISSLPMDSNTTEILSNCLPAESLTNLNHRNFSEEQAEEKKRRIGGTVMESAAPQEKQDEIVVVDLTADDDDEEVDDGASTVEFEPDVELDGRFTVDFELYAEPIPGLELLVGASDTEEFADSDPSP